MKISIQNVNARLTVETETLDLILLEDILQNFKTNSS